MKCYVCEKEYNPPNEGWGYATCSKKCYLKRGQEVVRRLKKEASKMREAIILAGGNSERMKPNIFLPKPLLPIDSEGQRLWEYQARWLKDKGFEHIILSTNEKIQALILKRGIPKDLNLPVFFCIESRKLGTGGAVRKSFEHIKGDKAYVMNVDDLVPDHNPVEMFDFCIPEYPAIILLAHPVSTYGNIEIGLELNDKLVKIKSFKQKPLLQNIWVNAGHYVFCRNAVRDFPHIGQFENTSLVLFPRKHYSYGYYFAGDWRTINNSKQYDRVLEFLRNRKCA